MGLIPANGEVPRIFLEVANILKRLVTLSY